MQCWEARHTYAEVINKRTPIESLDHAVRLHLRDCPDCTRLLQQFVQLAAAPGSDCAAARPELVNYAEAEMRGEGNQPQFAAVRLHLDLCVDCALDFALITEALMGAAAEPAQPPTQLAVQPPAADLSFLAQPQAAPPVTGRPAEESIWEAALRWEGPKRAILQFSADFLNAVAAWQRPAAMATARAGAEAQQLWRIHMASEDSALQISVTAEKQRRNPALVDLFFAVEDVERGGWPHLAGIEVECRWGEQERRQVVTDAFGQAALKNVSIEELASLSIVVDANDAA